MVMLSAYQIILLVHYPIDGAFFIISIIINNRMNIIVIRNDIKISLFLITTSPPNFKYFIFSYLNKVST